MKHTCARCGSNVPIGKHIYSKYTKSYYCYDLDACEVKLKKKKRIVQDFTETMRKEFEE